MQKSKKLVKVLAIIMMFSILFAITSLPASAAVSTSTAYAKDYEYLMVQKTAEFKSIKTNKITVMNKGNVPVRLYIGVAGKNFDTFIQTIEPGCEYTYSQYGYICKKFVVKVYSAKQAFGKQTITIKTTSGTLK